MGQECGTQRALRVCAAAACGCCSLDSGPMLWLSQHLPGTYGEGLAAVGSAFALSIMVLIERGRHSGLETARITRPRAPTMADLP